MYWIVTRITETWAIQRLKMRSRRRGRVEMDVLLLLPMYLDWVLTG